MSARLAADAVPPSEEACIQALFDAKYPNGFVCRSCSHRRCYPIRTRRLPLYECAACRAQTSLTAGTILENSRTPLRKWFLAIHLHARPEGINALQLSKRIEVTYKTAWLMCHKLRFAMGEAETAELLTGIVRVTDKLLYRRMVCTSSFHEQEQLVLIGASEEENGEIRRIAMGIGDKTKLRTRWSPTPAESFLQRRVAPEAADRADCKHRLGKERHWTLLGIGMKVDRWLAELFRGIGPKHLQVYLHHFCYQWNRQLQSMAAALLSDCATTRTITYPELTRAAARSSRTVRRTADRTRSVAG